MADRYPLIVNTGASQIQELASGDNLNLTGSNISAVTNITASGFMTINSGGSATAIINGGANSVGNIGSSTTYFNTVFAKATTALYADLAEKYLSDAVYPTGTVMMFGGATEVTQTTSSYSTAIAGVVSDKPAYIMNSGLADDQSATVALIGRVPCRVVGTINKGDCLVSSHIPGVATSIDPDQAFKPGSVIGKSMENYNSAEEGVIEVVVGRV
jgi:hypothetical protein